MCVKNSVHGGEYLGRHPPDQVHPLNQVHPTLTRYTPGTRYTPRPGTPSGPGTPPTPPGAVHAGRYGQQAGGTHPTGMHSCFIVSSKLLAMMQFKNLQIFDLHLSLLMLNQETDINLCPFEPPQNF